MNAAKCRAQGSSTVENTRILKCQSSYLLFFFFFLFLFITLLFSFFKDTFLHKKQQVGERLTSNGDCPCHLQRLQERLKSTKIEVHDLEVIYGYCHAMPWWRVCRWGTGEEGKGERVLVKREKYILTSGLRASFFGFIMVVEKVYGAWCMAWHVTWV